MTITAENLDSDYTPAPGTAYEVAPGCVRTLKRPVYNVVLAYDELLFKEDMTAGPNEEGYVPKLRLEMLEVITDGDALPKDYAGVDLDVVGRVVADFFTFRIAKAKKLSAS